MAIFDKKFPRSKKGVVVTAKLMVLAFWKYFRSIQEVKEHGCRVYSSYGLPKMTNFNFWQKNSHDQKRAWPPWVFPKVFARATFFGGSTYLLELIQPLKPYARIFSQMTPLETLYSLTRSKNIVIGFWNLDNMDN